MPQWKMIKLKLHKLAIRKRKAECIETNDGNCSKGQGLLPKSFPSKHVGSVSFSALSNKSSHEKLQLSQIGNLNVVHHPVTACVRELLEEQGIQMLGPIQVAPAEQEVLGIRGKLYDGKSSRPLVDAGKLLAFSDLFCKKMLKKAGLYLTRWKWKRSRRKDLSNAGAGGIGADSSLVGCVTASVDLRKEQESSEESGTIPRKNSSGHRNDKNAKITDNEVMQQEGADTDIELCKKKILMGEKCRPLTKSGMLHYDENGILLPEET